MRLAVTLGFLLAAASGEGAAQGTIGHKVLATSKTSTMEKELQKSSDAGFVYRGQTVFSSTFGGEEVVAILERDAALLAPNTTDAELVVRIYDKEGRVSWVIPSALRARKKSQS